MPSMALPTSGTPRACSSTTTLYASALLSPKKSPRAGQPAACQHFGDMGQLVAEPLPQIDCFCHTLLDGAVLRAHYQHWMRTLYDDGQSCLSVGGGENLGVCALPEFFVKLKAL